MPNSLYALVPQVGRISRNFNRMICKEISGRRHIMQTSAHERRPSAFQLQTKGLSTQRNAKLQNKKARQGGGRANNLHGATVTMMSGAKQRNLGRDDTSHADQLSFSTIETSMAYD